MTPEIIIQILLYGISLSMDAFAVSVTYSLQYTGINKKRIIIIALTFGLFQALMPLTSYWLIELIASFAGADRSQDIGNKMSLTVTWVAFALLVFIGGKMILEGIKALKKTEEEKEEKSFSYKELFILGIATSIDALAVGVSLHSGTLSDNTSIWLHAGIIMATTFSISLVGILLGSSISKLFRGKQELTSIIGGIILLALAVWVVLSHYTGL